MSEYGQYTKNLIQLVLAPTPGWEDIGLQKVDVRRLRRRLMYPCFGVAALSMFVQLAYGESRPICDYIVMAAVIFVSLFVTYAIARIYFVSQVAAYKMEGKQRGDAMVVAEYTLTLLAIATAFCNLLPVTLGLPFLMPLAIALVAWKSNVYLNINPEKDLSFSLLVLFAIALPPLIIQSIFYYLLYF